MQALERFANTRTQMLGTTTKRLLRFAVLAISLLFACSSEREDECTRDSDCPDRTDGAPEAAHCLGCSDKNVCVFRGRSELDEVSLCTYHEGGEPSDEHLAKDDEGPSGGSGGDLDCESSEYQPYDEIQVDSQCQAACIYTNGGNKNGCRGSCETYQKVAKATTTAAVKTCPACPCE